MIILVLDVSNEVQNKLFFKSEFSLMQVALQCPKPEWSFLSSTARPHGTLLSVPKINSVSQNSVSWVYTYLVPYQNATLSVSRKVNTM